MSPLFQKKLKPDQIFENVMKMQDEGHKLFALQTVLKFCKGNYGYLKEKVFSEILKLSKDPVKDLEGILLTLKDNELAKEIVNKIAGYGMEKKEVHQTLYSIGDFPSGNKAARKRARQLYDQFYDEATGGNPLKRPDLLIPTW